MTGLVDEGRAADNAYLASWKASDAVSRKILIEKLMRYGLDEQTAEWVENWAEQLGPEGGDQRHEVELEASN